MKRIMVWVLRPDLNKRKEEYYVNKILTSSIDTLYSNSPWDFKDYCVGNIHHKQSIDSIDYYDEVCSSIPDTSNIGIVLSDDKLLDYFIARDDTTIVELI